MRAPEVNGPKRLRTLFDLRVGQSMRSRSASRCIRLLLGCLRGRIKARFAKANPVNRFTNVRCRMADVAAPSENGSKGSRADGSGQASYNLNSRRRSPTAIPDDRLSGAHQKSCRSGSENALPKISYPPPTNCVLYPPGTLRCGPVIHLLHLIKKQTCLALVLTADGAG
jgi:hypothetical protein